MTPKQDRFITEYLTTGNGTQAAIKAGYSPKRADQQAYENLRKPEIRRALKDRLNEQGITESFLLQKISEGLEAYTVKTVSHEGKVTDERAYPNFAVRWRYIDTALKLRGMYPAEKKHGADYNRFAKWTEEELTHYIETGEEPTRFDEDG
jgi:hypothetical protein